jgi:hypothetical protein
MMDPNIGVFHPHNWQADILLSNRRRKVVLCGRQSGKTTLLKQIIYFTALSDSGKEILITAPTHGQVKELLWRSFTRADHPLFDPRIITYQNNQDMIIELFNGSRLTFKGTENISALLGRECDLIIFDEWQSHSVDVWTYLEPVLATRKGTAVFTGTARRGNHIMEFYQKGQENSLWDSWKITTPESGSPAGSEENLLLAQSSMSEEEYNQEYLCLPNSGEGSVYPGFNNANIIEFTDELPPVIRIGLDFNISQMNAVVGFRRDNKMFIIDEINQKFHNANTHSMVQEIKRRYPNKKILIYPDASGRNRTTNTVDADSTNHRILRQAGFELVFDHSGNPSIEDRIILLNSIIKPMIGETKFFVDKKCKNLIYSLEHRMYHNGKPDKSSGTDHSCDANEYLFFQLFKESGNQIRQLYK